MNLARFRGVTPAALAIMMLLGGTTWLLTGLWQERSAQSQVDRTTQEVALRLDGFAGDFERSLAYVRSVPVLIAHEPVAGATLTKVRSTVIVLAINAR